MEPTLLVGDRLFVTKYTYGYSKHSFPFSPNISDKRLFAKQPKRGDIIVFKTPADNRTDYIKRLIGLPGDEIQIINGNLFLNSKKILSVKIDDDLKIYCGNDIISTLTFKETLPSGKSYNVVYRKEGSIKNTDKYLVPKNHYFFMGDNRDCSKDSRFLSSVGYVNFNNIVGKARIIFLSNDKRVSSLINVFKWNKSIRFNRFLHKIK